MKRIFVLILLFSLLHIDSIAQIDRNNPIIRKQLELVDLMDEITDKIKLTDLIYKRISIVSFDYPDYIINESEALQIRSRIEGAFANSGFTVVSAPEFKQKPLTIVNGTDSNLTITRQNALERLVLNEEMMSEVIDKYSLQALVNVQLTYDHITGYQVNLQLVKSRSKELIFSAILNSNPDMYNPRRAEFFLSGGVGMHKAISFSVDGDDIIDGQDLSSVVSDLTLSWRQPFNKSYGGYYGFRAGVSMMQLLSSSSDSEVTKFSKIMPHAGLMYSICFLKKNEQPRKFWMEAFQSMGVLMSNSIDPYIRQGIIVNATQNLSIEVDYRFFLINSNFVDKNTNVLQLEKFGYGISFIYKP